MSKVHGLTKNATFNHRIWISDKIFTAAEERRITSGLSKTPGTTHRKDLPHSLHSDGVLVDFLLHQGKEKPQNRREMGEWLAQVGEAVALLAMVHEEQNVQVVSNIHIFGSS